MPSLFLKNLSLSVRNAIYQRDAALVLGSVAAVWNHQQELVGQNNVLCLETSTVVDLMTLKDPGVDQVVICGRHG